MKACKPVNLQLDFNNVRELLVRVQCLDRGMCFTALLGEPPIVGDELSYCKAAFEYRIPVFIML